MRNKLFPRFIRNDNFEKSTVRRNAQKRLRAVKLCIRIATPLLRIFYRVFLCSEENVKSVKKKKGKKTRSCGLSVFFLWLLTGRREQRRDQRQQETRGWRYASHRAGRLYDCRPLTARPTDAARPGSVTRARTHAHAQARHRFSLGENFHFTTAAAAAADFFGFIAAALPVRHARCTT